MTTQNAQGTWVLFAQTAYNKVHGFKPRAVFGGLTQDEATAWMLRFMRERQDKTIEYYAVKWEEAQ